LRRRTIVDASHFSPREVRAVTIEARMLGPLLLERPLLLLRGGRKVPVGPLMPGPTRARAARDRIASTLALAPTE